MDWSNLVEQLEGLTPLSTIVRLLLSALLAGLIGLNREKNQHAAGFRTHILVSVASTLVMLTNLYAYEVIMDRQGDAVRMAAQVISGIGFLGAGTIMVSGRLPQIRGLTTAASLWAVACIGLAVGIGFYLVAIAATVLILIVVSAFVVIDRRVRKKVYTLQFYLELEDVIAVREVINTCKAHDYSILSIELPTQRRKSGPQALMLLLEGREDRDHLLMGALEGVEGVNYVTSLDLVK